MHASPSGVAIIWKTAFNKIDYTTSSPLMSNSRKGLPHEHKVYTSWAQWACVCAVLEGVRGGVCCLIGVVGCCVCCCCCDRVIPVLCSSVCVCVCVCVGVCALC